MIIRKQIIYVLLCTFFFGCNPASPCPENEETPIIKKLTVLLIDASKSFNRKIKESGKFNGENYFDLACDNAKNHYLSKADTGQTVILRFISTDSWGTKSFVSSLNLSDTSLYFLKREPCDPFKIAQFEKREKREKENRKIKIDSLKNIALTEVDNFKQEYSLKGFTNTDLCGALASCLEDFKSEQYQDYEKEIILYSDLINSYPNSSDKCNYDFDFTGINITAKFVLDDRHSPKSFQTLREKWIDFFLNAKEFKTLTPPHSI